MSKKNLNKMTNEELLDYKHKLDEVYHKLKFEVNNWVKISTSVQEALKQRKEEIDIELDLLNSSDKVSSSEIKLLLNKLDSNNINIH